ATVILLIPGVMSDWESWTDSMPRCVQSGIGVVQNAKYNGGMMRHTHDFMHKCLNLSQNGIQFYGIFCAYNGDTRAAKYVSNRLVYEIFVENPITVDMSPEQIQEALTHKFTMVSELYNQDINELLTKRLLHKEQSTEESETMVKKINSKLRAGSTALVALVVLDHIYIVNCGNSRILALFVEGTNSDDWQLNEEHDLDNQEEVERLKNIGIVAETFPRPTRAVGDCFRGFCYTENEEFKGITGPPVISTPDVYVYDMEDQWTHLLLCSDSVVSSIEELGTEPEKVNPFLLSELLRERDHSHTKSCISLAQNSLSLEDTLDTDETETPVPYVDLDGFDEHKAANEVREDIDRIFVAMDRKNIQKDSIEEEPYSISI
ncbi:hypothetical protein PFISCL1PPCAC_27558, partial [Pristionchus fissidentatus]